MMSGSVMRKTRARSLFFCSRGEMARIFLTAKKRHKCKLCNKMYVSKEGVRAHQKRCHSPLIVSIELSKFTSTRQRDSESTPKQPPQDIKVDRECSESSSSVDSFKLVLDLDSADCSSDESCYSPNAAQASNDSIAEFSGNSVFNNSSINVSPEALVAIPSNDENLEWSAHSLHQIVREHSYSDINSFLAAVASPQEMKAENNLPPPYLLNNAPWGIWRDQVTGESHWVY